MLNIDGTMGHKIKTRKHPGHGTQCVIQYPTNKNPAQSLQENAITVFGPRLYNSLPKYLRDIGSVKTEKFKFELEIIPDLILGWWAQNGQLCHRSRKQQHPRPAHSSEGSRNLPRWWSPRLGHCSKPLKVSKYKRLNKLWDLSKNQNISFPIRYCYLQISKFVQCLTKLIHFCFNFSVSI